ncbi:MAG TPA: hypothetical protein VFC19_13175 [Candidatus Limnocylindrales bacterium]|nr:hypothetical protein [Candidatus Limnocylindrales bacterium]
MRYLTIVASLLLVTTGCTGGSGNRPAPKTDATAAWRAFVACARANGKPAWPDPVVDTDSGQATFPETPGFNPKAEFEAVRDACGHELDTLPPQANPLARPVVGPSELQMKLRDAQCMRDNGVPEWPDPGADGYYHGFDGIPGYNTDPAVTQRVNAARNVCDPLRGR